MEKTFVRSRAYGQYKVVIDNCYCITDYSDDQKSRIYRILAGDNVSIALSGATPPKKEYNISGITFHSAGLSFDDALYAGSTQTLSLNLTATPREGYTYVLMPS